MLKGIIVKIPSEVAAIVDDVVSNIEQAYERAETPIESVDLVKVPII